MSTSPNIQFRKTIWIVFVMLLLLLAGCRGAPASSPATPVAQQAPAESPAAGTTSDVAADLAYTQAAATIFAEFSQTPPPLPLIYIEVQAASPVEALPSTSTPLPTNTPLPSDTPIPSNTPTVTNTPLPTDTPTPAEPPFELVFEDDFSVVRGWPQVRGDEFRMRNTAGGYVIEVDLTNDAVWGVREDGYGDVRVETEAYRKDGARDGYYGVVCRFENGSNYYLFFVGSDGSYGIAKQFNGKLTFLQQLQDTQAIIKTGSTPNRVRGDCIGTTLTLYVNGVEMASVEDADFGGGSVGIAAGTRRSPGYDVFFQYFALYVPE